MTKISEQLTTEEVRVLERSVCEPLLRKEDADIEFLRDFARAKIAACNFYFAHEAVSETEYEYTEARDHIRESLEEYSLDNISDEVRDDIEEYIECEFGYDFASEMFSN